jgi:hypothetical protein
MWIGADQYLGTTINALLVMCGLQFALIRMDGQILDVTMRIAPKVLVGLLSSAGGIAVGCIGFALTHNLAVALVAVIVVRLVSNAAYPVFVARAIPESAVAWRPVILAAALLVLSFGIGPLAQSGALPVKAGLAVAWVLAAGTAAWFGLVPRTTVQALLATRAHHDRTLS